MNLAFSLDYPYFKDAKSFTLEAGNSHETHKKAPFRGNVMIKISSTNPVNLNIDGPHVEKLEVSGSKEFMFPVEPDTEFFIGLQGKKSLFSDSSTVTLELQMLGAKKAYEVLEKVKNLISMLQDNPDFYELQKDAVKEVLKEVIEVWGQYGDETRKTVKELIALTKRMEKPK